MLKQLGRPTSSWSRVQRVEGDNQPVNALQLFSEFSNDRPDVHKSPPDSIRDMTYLPLRDYAITATFEMCQDRVTVSRHLNDYS